MADKKPKETEPEETVKVTATRSVSTQYGTFTDGKTYSIPKTHAEILKQWGYVADAKEGAEADATAEAEVDADAVETEEADATAEGNEGETNTEPETAAQNSDDGSAFFRN